MTSISIQANPGDQVNRDTNRGTNGWDDTGAWRNIPDEFWAQIKRTIASRGANIDPGSPQNTFVRGPMGVPQSTPQGGASVPTGPQAPNKADDQFANVLGTVGPTAYAQAPGVTAPNQATYQIPGLSDYTSQLSQLQNGMPGAPDLTGATSGATQMQQSILDYLRGVGSGQTTTAADAMFQQGSAQAARNAQSQAVSAQGMSPGLAQRQIAGANSAAMGNIAGQSAQQKLQQMMTANQMGLAGARNLAQQQMVTQQAEFQNRMMRNQAVADLGQRIFSANQTQTNYNVEFAQNKQAFEQYMRTQYLDQVSRQAAARAKIIQAGAATGSNAMGNIFSQLMQRGSFGSGNGGGGGGNPADPYGTPDRGTPMDTDTMGGSDSVPGSAGAGDLGGGSSDEGMA